MSATNFSSAKALKKLFTVSTFMLLTAIGTNANAYGYKSTCSENWYGDWVCSYGNSGYQTTTTTDWYGNDVTTDRYGNRMSCSYDWYGNYVCNY